MRTVLIAGALIAAIAFLAMQNQKIRSERNLYRDRLEAVAGSREIENAVRQIDDCGLFGLLTGGLPGQDGGAVLGCSADATRGATSNGGLPDPE